MHEMIGKVVLGLWILHFLSLSAKDDRRHHRYGAEALEGFSSSSSSSRLVDESLDELNDAEIFRAVVNSIHEWELKKQRQQHRAGLHQRHKREVSRVCYEDVGCFEDTGPFSYLEMLPSPPKDVGTRFFVYGSRKARSVSMTVPAESISEKASSAIDPELPTKVIVHGFGSSCDHVWVYEMRSVLAAVIDCNIVCVDWGPGSAVPNYVRAAANTRLVGRQLAKLVRSLNVPLSKVHMIGFSLGAHVAGFAGAELGNVSRITGLDPAGPLFESQDPRARLDETDAHFVDVIHSNGEQLILGGLGSWQPMGDVDFYPNGGRMQTGCSNLFVGAVTDIIWSANSVEGRSLCNHRRAYKLFTDSISPKCRFPAFPCASGYDGLLRGECFPCGSRNSLHPELPCADMGFYSDRSSARGQLYLVTRDEEPFCAHQYQVRVYNSRHERPVKSYGRLQVTLASEGSINETFAMTKKDDEELLVGATLQRIVVPHPSLASIDAIEIKYTAYSGWISSGLVSWAVDKISVTDSYGAVNSICKRGLVLESGKPVYLSLQRGDCSVPPDDAPPTDQILVIDGGEKLTVEQQPPPPPLPGIGPFTREHNYERGTAKDSSSSSSFGNEVPQNAPKGLGPFTKEHNVMTTGELGHSATKEPTKNHPQQQQSVSPWSLGELTNDGSSNSVETGNGGNSLNEHVERGRGFSGSAAAVVLNLDRSNVLPVITVAPELLLQQQQPSSTDHELLLAVELRLPGSGTKKESGRSLRLPEITEPVLRPRGTRQDSTASDSLSTTTSTTSTTTTTTTATSTTTTTRTTATPEISTTTMANRGFTVQFLPERLAGILAQAERYARQTLLPLISQYTPSFIGQAGKTERPKYFPPLGNLFGNRDSGDEGQRKRPDSKYLYFEFNEDPTATTTTEKLASTTVERDQRLLAIGEDVDGRDRDDDSWVPLTVAPHSTDNRGDKSLAAGEWMNEGGSSWSPRNDSGDANATETKIDDWVPIVPPAVVDDSNGTSGSTTMTSKRYEEQEEEEEEEEEERKFIPLLDFARGSGDPPKIEDEAVKRPRSIVFPYLYERKNDPRTRYIPLVPQEDLGVPAMDDAGER